jgi:hypothetical protein
VRSLVPLHGDTVRAREALRALDDCRGDRIGIELERRDLLLNLHDLVQPGEAVPETLLVALALRDVAERGVDAAVVEHAHRVLDVDERAVLAAESALGAQLAAGPQLRLVRRGHLQLAGREQHGRVQRAQLVDRVPEHRGGSGICIEQVPVEVADERRIGALRVQLAVLALALGQALDELRVAQRDRRAADE